MVFFAKRLQTVLSSPTIVVLTDRNDLDNQLYCQFSRCADFLRQTPVQAESRTNLKELLIWFARCTLISDHSANDRSR